MLLADRNANLHVYTSVAGLVIQRLAIYIYIYMFVCVFADTRTKLISFYEREVPPLLTCVPFSTKQITRYINLYFFIRVTSRGPRLEMYKMKQNARVKRIFRWNKASHLQVVFSTSGRLQRYKISQQGSRRRFSRIKSITRIYASIRIDRRLGQIYSDGWQVHKRRQVYAREMNVTSVSVQFRGTIFDARYFRTAHKAHDLWQQVLASCRDVSSSKILPLQE